MTMVTAAAIALYAVREPFDSMHQKRLFIIHMENVSPIPSRALLFVYLPMTTRLQRTSSIYISQLRMAHLDLKSWLRTL